MTFSTIKLSLILFGLAQLLKFQAFRHAAFRARLKERNLVAQIMARDEETGRWFEFKDGTITSGAGLHPAPDIKLMFKNAAWGAKLLTPPINWLNQINAQKDFILGVDGPEDLTNWFAQTLMMSQTVGWKIGTRLEDGTMRYCNMTNGGPVFVYVKDGKIVRMTPIDFDDDDPKSWTIEARGMNFTPPRKTTLAPHGQNAKSIVYSPDRLLYPMKRVDFDPNGERNPQNRGKSGYVRISWEEAITLVTDEIKRQKREHGPGAITFSHGSHHTWGNIGYYLSALFRFANAVGMTRVHHNPDSWEGWYWGAVHHWGYTLRVGQSETYGTVEDCLQNCDMIVSWAADPESTSGSYGAQEGTVRRQWLKNPKLGIKIVHVDPYYNATAQFLPGKWFAPRADHLGRDGDGDRLCVDQGRPLRQGLCEDPHGRLRQLEGLSHRRRGRHRQDARMAGEGNRRPGQGRAGAGARMGQEARLSRARRLGQRPRRRLPQPDRHPVGARDGVPLRHAGARQARLQHGQPAMGLPARLQFLFPRLCRRRHVGRSREHLDAGRALPAHAAAADHELELPAHSAHLDAGSHHGRQGRGLSAGSASRSSTSSPSSPIRRPATRRCTCSTSTAARSSPP